VGKRNAATKQEGIYPFSSFTTDPSIMVIFFRSDPTNKCAALIKRSNSFFRLQASCCISLVWCEKHQSTWDGLEVGGWKLEVGLDEESK
jgi:hypothetical protein